MPNVNVAERTNNWMLAEVWGKEYFFSLCWKCNLIWYYHNKPAIPFYLVTQLWEFTLKK